MLAALAAGCPASDRPAAHSSADAAAASRYPRLVRVVADLPRILVLLLKIANFRTVVPLCLRKPVAAVREGDLQMLKAWERLRPLIGDVAASAIAGAGQGGNVIARPCGLPR